MWISRSTFYDTLDAGANDVRPHPPLSAIGVTADIGDHC